MGGFVSQMFPSEASYRTTGIACGFLMLLMLYQHARYRWLESLLLYWYRLYSQYTSKLTKDAPMVINSRIHEEILKQQGPQKKAISMPISTEGPDGKHPDQTWYFHTTKQIINNQAKNNDFGKT